MAPFRLTVAACAAATALVTPCWGDDWPQFRRDAQRSASSKDRLLLPLTEVWSWTTRLKDGHSPLFHAVTAGERIFFTAGDDETRWLVCARATTGKVLWRQQLEAPRLKFALSDAVGPGVTAGGQVVVYDWTDRSGRGSQAHQSDVRGSSFVVKTFRAADGRPLQAFPLAMMGANGVLPRLSLTPTLQGQEVRPVPPTFVGCPP
jgi:outer membrane protein assembly factor BamB